MPKDYKSRANRPSGGRKQSPCWVWFIGGILLGAFGAGLVWLKLSPPGGADRQFSTDDPNDASATRKPARNRPPPPRFDFYTLLPEMEVVIPEEELKRTRPKPKPTHPAEPMPATAAQEAYLLQMGSFRNAADADRLKARLALLDISVQIQKVTINNRDTFHRVRSGPYRNPERVKKVRERLRRNNIKSIVIKLKQ